MYKFGERSLNNLEGVHPDLVMLMEESIKDSPYDFAIIEGVRTPTRQKELYDQGKSLTLLSRHIKGKDGFGKAVDIMAYVNGKGTWEMKYYKFITDHVKTVAATLDIEIICGIDWRSFKDAVHIELDKNKYN
jgi:peptidoglycan L-alanyl-D-glutamate endopeptidase CwlK